jgi:hypothetical protein
MINVMVERSTAAAIQQACVRGRSATFSAYGPFSRPCTHPFPGEWTCSAFASLFGINSNATAGCTVWWRLLLFFSPRGGFQIDTSRGMSQGFGPPLADTTLPRLRDRGQVGIDASSVLVRRVGTGGVARTRWGRSRVGDTIGQRVGWSGGELGQGVGIGLVIW